MRKFLRLFGFYDCLTCRDTGYVRSDVPVAYDDLTDRERADMALFGGHFVRTHKRPCPSCERGKSVV